MIRTKDLKKVTATTHALYCSRCHASYSADPSDYFLDSPEREQRCSCTKGRKALQLVPKSFVAFVNAR